MSDSTVSVPNPDVVVPEGNFKSGKALFQDLCMSCHKMRVILDRFRVMAKDSRLLHWATSLEEKQGRPNITVVKH